MTIEMQTFCNTALTKHTYGTLVTYPGDDMFSIIPYSATVCLEWYHGMLPNILSVITSTGD